MVRYGLHVLLLVIVTLVGLLYAPEAAAQQRSVRAGNGVDMHRAEVQRELASLQATMEREEAEQRYFPEKRPGQLAKLPHLGTASEVFAYVKGIQIQVAATLSAGRLQEVKKAVDACNGAAAAIEATAVAAWYSHAYKEALVLAAEACLKNKEEHLLLNNLGALLNLAGGEYKALPVLKWLAREYPASPMVLNNIGQAYTGVGELDTAMTYFARCLEEVPNHPETNNTAGEIEAARGNTQKAEAHFEKAVNGGITSATLKRLQRLSSSGAAFPDYVSRYVRPRVKLPDIFNAYKYQPVRQIRTVDEARPLAEEHAQFEDFLHNVVELYAELVQKEDEAGHALHEKNLRMMARDPLAYAEDMGRYVSPLAGPAGVIYARLAHSYRLRREDLANYRKQREEEIYQLQLAMGEQLAKIAREDYDQCLRETNCTDCNPEAICNRTVLYPLTNKAANEFLTKAADIREEIQRKELALARETYENLAYFGYLAGPNRHLAKANFYKACHDYAAAILQANETAFVAKAGEEGKELEQKPGGTDVPADMSCPINVKLEWGVAKFEVSCEKFKISAFGGMIKGSRNAKTRQSTLHLGAELGKEFERTVDGVKGTIKVGMEESFFITFDEHGSLVDGGLAFEAKATAAISSAATTGTEGIKKIEAIGKGDVGFGYTLGVASGWTFTEGPLATILAPLFK